MQHNLPFLAKPFRLEELCRIVNRLLYLEPRTAEQWDERSRETSLGTEIVDEGNRVSTD